METKLMQHTPTPWVVYHQDVGFHGRRYVSIRSTAIADGGISYEILGDIAWVIDGPKEHRIANALRIVRAVNAHDGFLDLAKALIERGPDAPIGESLIESAQHWIAKTEGSPQ